MRNNDGSKSGLELNRRGLLGSGAMAGLLGIGASSSAYAQKAAPKRGGRLLIGSAGGGAKDKLDAHGPRGYA